MGFPFCKAWLIVDWITPARPFIPELPELDPELELELDPDTVPDVLKSVTAFPRLDPDDVPTDTGVDDPVIV